MLDATRKRIEKRLAKVDMFVQHQKLRLCYLKQAQVILKDYVDTHALCTKAERRTTLFWRLNQLKRKYRSTIRLADRSAPASYASKMLWTKYPYRYQGLDRSTIDEMNRSRNEAWAKFYGV